jgi:Rrf2 family iron-sulfur cluster assembly transcriptional regulator
MRLTTKGRFAVTAMIDLALRQNNGPVTLAAISQRQQISLSYLEQLFGKLRRNELVESTRGPGGGYSLGRKAGDITVADIIVTSVDEPLDATHCGGARTAGRRRALHDARPVGRAERAHGGLPAVGHAAKAGGRAARQGLRAGRPPAAKRAISAAPVVKPIRITAPNSVFALGGLTNK